MCVCVFTAPGVRCRASLTYHPAGDGKHPQQNSAGRASASERDRELSENVFVRSFVRWSVRSFFVLVVCFDNTLPVRCWGISFAFLLSDDGCRGASGRSVGGTHLLRAVRHQNQSASCIRTNSGVYARAPPCTHAGGRRTEHPQR